MPTPNVVKVAATNAGRRGSKVSESESQFFSEQNPHNNPASSSKGGGNGHGWYRFGFTDPEQRRQYRIFCQEDTNILLIVLTGLMTIASFLTRFNLSNFWAYSPTMVLSFVVGVVSVVGGVASTTVRLAQWSPIASYPLRPGGLGYRVREQLQSVHDSDVAWTIINDLLMLTFPTACSLNVLARTQLGPCPAGTSAWDSQLCNSGGPIGIPLESTILMFTAPWMLQTFMRGARLEAVVLTYAVQAVVVNLALSTAGSTLHPWLNLMLVEGLMCAYEMDRHSRKVFLNQRKALYFVEKNSKLKVEMAERDLDAKRAMVRHISHEIRTPLNITAVGMDTLLRTLHACPPSKTKDFMQETVESCVVACEDALTIVTELLDFEKLAAGMCTLEKVPTRVVPWIEDTVKTFRVSASSKGLTIDYQHPAVGSPEERQLAADMDPLKMAMVMRNLLSNAIKFSKAGGTIVVTIERSLDRHATRKSFEDQHGACDSLRISVKDNGAGLSKDNIGRLFQEGVQINPNKLQKGGGSGFGLFITKGIVKLHGGSIWATSEDEGHGTTFSVQLPLCKNAAVLQLLSLDLPETAYDVAAEASGDKGKSVLSVHSVRSNRSDLSDDEDSSGFIAAVMDHSTSRSTHSPQSQSRGMLFRGQSVSARRSTHFHRSSIAVADIGGIGQMVMTARSVSSGRDLPTLRILIVDDSMLNRRMIRNALKMDGHTCEEAEDGLDAVSRLLTDGHDHDGKGLGHDAPHASALFDVVLIDNHMPRMNGTTATQEMRRRGYAGVIIGITGDDDQSSKQEFLTAGANDCLVKPISHDGLVKCLLTHVKDVPRRAPTSPMNAAIVAASLSQASPLPSAKM